MEASLTIPTAKILLFQTLVKQHNLRFVGTIFTMGDTTHVAISSNHLAPGSAYAFFEDWERLNRSVIEKKSSTWQSLWRRIKGRLPMKDTRSPSTP